MNKLVTIACLLFVSLSSLSAHSLSYNDPSNKVKFFAGSFEHAKTKAGSEGKLFFVEFYADWCTPCKWMDKTTFRNEGVISQLNNNYVALKLDIESGEGHDLKHQYEVNILPTILIFNSQGRMIERIEKTLSSESMISMLSFHDNPQNKVVVKHSYNQSPFGQSRGPSLEHLYEQYSLGENFRSNYKLLVGNYFDYKDAHFKVKELQENFEEPVVIMNQYIENTTQYKVLMGAFPTLEDAEAFKKKLKSENGLETTVY